MVSTVANSAENLIGQHRTDDTWLANANIARSKAYTTAALQMAMHELANLTHSGESFWALQTTDENCLVVFDGGYLSKTDGEIVSTIGVSGGEVAQDTAVLGASERFDELAR